MAAKRTALSLPKGRPLLCEERWVRLHPPSTSRLQDFNARGGAPAVPPSQGNSVKRTPSKIWKRRHFCAPGQTESSSRDPLRATAPTPPTWTSTPVSGPAITTGALQKLKGERDPTRGRTLHALGR